MSVKDNPAYKGEWSVKRISIPGFWEVLKVAALQVRGLWLHWLSDGVLCHGRRHLRAEGVLYGLYR